MDRLGGILTGGLLGNMILGRFNLFFGIIDIEVVPRGGAGGTSVRFPEEEEYAVSIRVRVFQKDYRSSYTVKQKTARVLVKALQRIRTISNKLSVKANIKQEKNVSVRIKE